MTFNPASAHSIAVDKPVMPAPRMQTSATSSPASEGCSGKAGTLAAYQEFTWGFLFSIINLCSRIAFTLTRRYAPPSDKATPFGIRLERGKLNRAQIPFVFECGDLRVKGTHFFQFLLTENMSEFFTKSVDDKVTRHKIFDGIAPE